MKIVSITALLVVMIQSCDKSNFDCDNPIRGKLVRNTCVDPLVQILDSNYFHLGENWTEPPATGSGISYQNVFVVDNMCKWYRAGVSEGEEFYFCVLDEDNETHCAVCAMWVPSPDKRLKIKVRSN